MIFEERKTDEVCSRCGNKGDPQATAGCLECHRSGPDSEAGMITMRRMVGGGTALTRMLSAAAFLSMSAPPSRPDFDDSFYPSYARRTAPPPPGRHRASPEKKKKRKATDTARRKQR